MTTRAYDPEFVALIPTLPTVQDFSSAEKIQAIREFRMTRDKVLAGSDGAKVS